ncbi:hypothetical protein ROA7450_01188 [Roseovarius albus]|uniref:DUF7946 domain-containing protein n=1 Tax=Roseovarius albus TaxID=1247867 RepID=A0A1X6YRN0_9RHOB|nr:hypothetical protein [Roseovarius albus]SLN28619.1 hypothetical protein ROA7450_01188 [Roseovarius albus]
MAHLAQHKIKIRYTGGLADQNTLPAYDGATSIDGITRALHIATHAYMTGEVVSRATALRGASLVLKPARPGSFIFEIIALLEANPATTGAAVGLAAAPFYDFIKTAFKRATGWLDAEPETRHLQKLYERKQPPNLLKAPADLDELAETLEGSLQAAHRPIGAEGTIGSIEIGSSRQNLLTFDEESKGWVNTREEAAALTVYQGNITRYNALSRNGRAFIDQLGRVIPLRPDGDFPVGDLSHLTWSLHGSNVGARNKLLLRARTVTSANGKVKRLLLSDCQRAPET